MSESDREAIRSVLSMVMQAWQLGAALVVLTLAWAAMASDIRQTQAEHRAATAALTAQIEAAVTLGTTRRQDVERRMDERDGRHEARLTVVEGRATAAEISLARIGADVQAVKAGVDELLREMRTQRQR